MASIEAYKRALELLKADAEGRLVVLPCKVGDTVWLIVTKRRRYNAGGTYSYIQEGRLSWNNLRKSLNCIGKTVFLTREEAEAALEKMGGGEK